MHITCTSLSKTSLSEKGCLVQQLALRGSPGQGQSLGTVAFRGAGGQGITAGETLLHKEFMRAKKLGQGMHRSRDLRKISTESLAESGHYWTKVPDLVFHRTVLYQIHVSSYRFHVTLGFWIQVSRLENWNEGYCKRKITVCSYSLLVPRSIKIMMMTRSEFLQIKWESWFPPTCLKGNNNYSTELTPNHFGMYSNIVSIQP